MVSRTTTVALTLAAMVGLVVALAGVPGAARANPKPSPSPSPSPTPSPSPPPAAAPYSITDLGSLGGGYTEALAINNNGQVTGYSAIAATIPTSGCCGNCYGGKRIPCTTHPTHAFVWSNGTMTDLGTLGGNYSQGLSINLSGQVVGSADTTTGSSSFVWNGTKMTALSGLTASGINDSGQIAGACAASTGSYPCVDSNGKFTALPSPPNLSCGGASAINNNGQVIGGCGDASGNSQAALWSNGTVTELGTFGGPTSVATALNNLGHVVGYSMTSSYAQHGFLWSNGTMTDLGDNFIAAAVNDNDVVVWSDLIYSGGAVQNLNNLIPAGSGYQITYAKGINDKGQIVAEAYTPTYQTHALLLTPN